MIIKKDLRLSNVKQCSNGNGYMVSFLDENDDKITLYYTNDKAKRFLSMKQYDKTSVDLQFYLSSKNGKYNVMGL